MTKRLIWVAGFAFLLAALFCVAFVFFYNRMQRSLAESTESSSSKSFINKALPQAQLIDPSGVKVDEHLIRTGRVVLVFVTTECQACLVESEFLRTLLNRRKDVTFYGLVAFGKRTESLQAAEKMFPFKVFYDDGGALVSSIGINKVPVKVFLENGIIKKGWIGAATSDRAKKSFTDWLDGLP
jgi:hypothetical protein